MLTTLIISYKVFIEFENTGGVEWPDSILKTKINEKNLQQEGRLTIFPQSYKTYAIDRV